LCLMNFSTQWLIILVMILKIQSGHNFGNFRPVDSLVMMILPLTFMLIGSIKTSSWIARGRTEIFLLDVLAAYLHDKKMR